MTSHKNKKNTKMKAVASRAPAQNQNKNAIVFTP